MQKKSANKEKRNRKGKKKNKRQEIYRKQSKRADKFHHINNNTKCEWIKQSNQRQRLLDLTKQKQGLST